MERRRYELGRKEIEDWLNQPDQEDSFLSAEQAEDALVQYAQAHALTPPAGLKDSIMERIRLLNAQQSAQQALDLNNLPFLDASSNWLEWQAAVADIQPPDEYEDIHMHTLESNEKRDLFVIWVKQFVPEEVHHDLLESFMILEGSCECYITNEVGETRTVRLGAGEFITMQLGETHDIHITSEKPAKAILQWHKLAA